MDVVKRDHRPIRPRRRGRRLAFVLALLIVLTVGVLHWYRSGLAPTGVPEKVVAIEQGSTPDRIAERLKSEGLIKSERTFTLYVRLKGLAPELKSGRYLISGKQGAGEIARLLTKESNLGTQFTIPEGLTQFGIAERLEKLGIADAEEFKALKATDFPEYAFLRSLPDDATLEGYLFPETYEIPKPGTSAREVATILLNQFQEQLTALQPRIDKSGRSVHEIVTIASLVEEEVKTEKDRRLVAGVIESRLEQDIRLDIDATVRYALGKPSDTLTAADLDSDDPYNTRRFKGLPPGPIANPGLASLEAVLDPTDSEFLFYLSSSDGTTVFSETLEEHEANVEKYLR